MSSSIEITPELMADFLDEAPEYLEMLDAGLMELESAAGTGVLSLEDADDMERMNVMFRAAHSLKGLAAAFGFDRITQLTHRMETLFDEVRMRKRDLTAKSFETLFRVFDRLKDLVAELTDEPDSPVVIDDVLSALDHVLNDDGNGSSTEAEAAPSNTSDDGSGDVLSDPELVQSFLETVSESLDDLNTGLLNLEERPDDSDLLNMVFRAAHNIKGASGAAGLLRLNRLTHEMETVFDGLRNKLLSIDDALMNVFFGTVDTIRRTIDQIREGRRDDVEPIESDRPFASWVADLADASTSPVGAPCTVVGDSAAANLAAAESGQPATTGGSRLRVNIFFEDGFDEATIQAFLISAKLAEFGDVVHSEPDLDSLVGDSVLQQISFVVETDAVPCDVEQVLSAYDVKLVEVIRESSTGESDTDEGCAAVPAQPQVAESPQPEERQPANAQPSGDTTASVEKPMTDRKKTAATSSPGDAAQGKAAGRSNKPAIKGNETLRVDLERLDQLMNLGGELVINRARFTQVRASFRNVFEGKSIAFVVDEISEQLNQMETRAERLITRFGPDADLASMADNLNHLRQSFGVVGSLVRNVHDARTAMHDFDEALHSLTRVSDGLQKGIMGTRMVPIGPLFSRFRRVVRDICKSTGKEVELILQGEGTELDKRMIDELGDPLTHMIRNSVDHGIELPDERRAAGKDPKGKLILNACHRGNTICIEVIDDGAGINIDRVKAKAIERGLATEAQIEKLTNREICQFVLQPGFSTAEKVTDLSGRGMGMDIVTAKIDKLNGAIDLDSTPGEGTRVVIKLPLTLAILTALVIRIGRGVYAVPLEAVAEIITVRRSDVQAIQRRRVVRVREHVVPLSLLEEIYRFADPAMRTESRDADEMSVVIVCIEDQKIGLVVDELYGQDDIVIKSIAENYRNVKGFAGASIRGDGSVALILDVGAMMEMAAAAVVSGQTSANQELVEV